MPSLLSGNKLNERLQELIAESNSIDLAVAWATSWNGLDQLLDLSKRHNNKGRIRIIVGVSGFITTPAALRKMSKYATLRIYGTPTGQLFHPKMYIFTTSTVRRCWIGSGNMTNRAFTCNVEMVLETEEENGGPAEQEFMKLWNSSACTSIADFNIEEYEREYKIAKRKRPPFLAAEVDTPCAATNSISADVLTGEWNVYAARLRETANLNNWLKTLRAGYEFVRRDWARDIDAREECLA